MENASKALLMAGGILIALIIIGALILMFNQLGTFQKAQTANEKGVQLAEFNLDFERYIDDKGIKGTDVISLINKVIDYNKKGGINNSVDYDIKMSITISGLKEFNKKYAYDKNSDIESLFTQDQYTFDQTNMNNELKVLLNNFSIDEGNIGIENLKKLSSIYDAEKIKAKNIENIKEKLVEIDPEKYQNWNGSNLSPTLDSIKKYRQYSEFKTSTFKASKNPVYKNGQITELYLEFVK